jgi:serine/threonine protein kinase
MNLLRNISKVLQNILYLKKKVLSVEEQFKKIIKQNSSQIDMHAQDFDVNKRTYISLYSITNISQQLSNYSIIQKLYEGRHLGNNVYIVVDEKSKTKRKCVMKCYDIHILKQKKLFFTIKREIVIMSQITHPRIIQLYHAFIDKGNIVLIMEYAEYGDMLQFRKAFCKLRINNKQAQIIIFQILEALLYLHSNAIMHRDIKLENIFISDLGVKLGDFGAAIDTGKEFASTRIGTCEYMAPEIFHTVRSGQVQRNLYSSSVDIWALGILTYEILVGITPCIFQDDIYVEPYYPAFMDINAINFIKLCLHVDPILRPSASELMNHAWFNTVSYQNNRKSKCEEKKNPYTWML